MNCARDKEMDVEEEEDSDGKRRLQRIFMDLI